MIEYRIYRMVDGQPAFCGWSYATDKEEGESFTHEGAVYKIIYKMDGRMIVE